MTMSRWIKAVGALAALLGSMPVALAQDAKPVRGGTLNYGVAGGPHTLDCHAGNSFAVLHHLGPHYSTLLKIDNKNYPKVTGDLAESWTVSDDHLTYTFKIRPNVKFHDGTPLTSEDIRASFERIMNPPPGVVSSWRSQYSDVKSVEAPDKDTVVFHMSAPNSGMLSIFASPWACIYSAAKLKEDPKYPEKTVMGTGPFQLVEYVPGSHWTGKRFDGYFRPGLPYLNGFKAIALSSTALINALAGGQIDAEFRGVAPADQQRIQASRGASMRFEEAEGMGLFMVSFNTKVKPFDDIRVRRALTLAVDRWSGIQPMSRISTLKYVSAFQRPGAPDALPQAELEKLPGFGRDIKAARAEAKRLLAEAGVPNLKFTLINRGPDMPYAPFALYVIDQWRQIGVTVDQQVVDTANWAQRRTSGNFSVIVDVTGDWGEDPSFVLVRYLSASNSFNNPTGFDDPKIDAMFEAQKLEFDPVKRKQKVNELESYIVEQVFTMPVFRTVRLLPLATKVKNFDVVPAHIYYGDLSEVWLSP
jgi:peptide/nickel transport system substrate-binding protein